MNLEHTLPEIGVTKPKELPSSLSKIVNKETLTSLARGFLIMTMLAAVEVGLVSNAQAQEIQKPGINQAEQNREKFKKITEAYKIFDDSNSEKTTAQLLLYEQNKSIMPSLPLWEQAEFLHQRSFVQYSAIKLKYGVKPDAQFITPSADALNVNKNDILKDSKILRDTYNQLERSLDIALNDPDIVEDKSKIERILLRAQAKRQTRNFLNSINATTPESIRSKEMAIAKLRAGISKFTKGGVNFTGPFELKNPVSSDLVKFTIKFVDNKGTEFLFSGLMTFDVIDGKIKLTNVMNDSFDDNIDLVVPTKEEIETIIN